MSKRSVRKVRHFDPSPSIRERVISGKAVMDGGDEIHLMDAWRANNPRAVPTYREKHSGV